MARIAALQALGLEGPYLWRLIKYDRRNAGALVEHITAPMSIEEIANKHGACRYRMAVDRWTGGTSPLHVQIASRLRQIASVDFEIV